MVCRHINVEKKTVWLSRARQSRAGPGKHSRAQLGSTEQSKKAKSSDKQQHIATQILDVWQQADQTYFCIDTEYVTVVC